MPYPIKVIPFNFGLFYLPVGFSRLGASGSTSTKVLVFPKIGKIRVFFWQLRRVVDMFLDTKIVLPLMRDNATSGSS